MSQVVSEYLPLIRPQKLIPVEMNQVVWGFRQSKPRFPKRFLLPISEFDLVRNAVTKVLLSVLNKFHLLSEK